MDSSRAVQQTGVGGAGIISKQGGKGEKKQTLKETEEREKIKDIWEKGTGSIDLQTMEERERGRPKNLKRRELYILKQGNTKKERGSRKEKGETKNCQKNKAQSGRVWFETGKKKEKENLDDPAGT